MSWILLLVAVLAASVSAQLVPIPVVPSDNGTIEYITLFFTAEQFEASGDYFVNPSTWALGTDLLFQDLGLPAARFQLDRAPQPDINHNRQINFIKLVFRVLPQSSPFMQFTVFGDSLVDDHNYWLLRSKLFPPSPPYFYGAFSNGPTMVNNAQAQLRVPSTGYLNYGLGLATLDQVKANIDEFLADRPRSVNPQMLFFHNGGAYDILNAFAAVFQGVPLNATTLIGSLLAKTYRNVNTLVEAGAKQIVVLDITNLGGAPLVTFLKSTVAPGLDLQVAGVTAAANAAIKANVTSGQWADVSIIYVDSSALLATIKATPSSYGINDTVGSALTPCCFPSGQLLPFLGLPQYTYVATDANNKMFFDDTMPTGTVHFYAAQEILSALKQGGFLPDDACTSAPLASDLAITALNTFNHRKGLRVPKTCEGQLAQQYGCTKQVYQDSTRTRLDNMDFLYAEPGVASSAVSLTASLFGMLLLLAAML